MQRQVDLTAEALVEQRVGNGLEIRQTLLNAHLNGAAADGAGAAEEIGQADQHQAVGLLCHELGESFRRGVLHVHGEGAVHLDRAEGHIDNVIALEVFLHLVMGHLGQKAGSHFVSHD